MNMPMPVMVKRPLFLQELVTVQLKLAEEIMGKEATKKLKVRGLVFP